MNSFLLIQKDITSHKNTVILECSNRGVDPLDITIINSSSDESPPENDQRQKGIALIRQAIKSMYLKPIRGKQKAVVVLQADTLSIPAQNALLKTLEEPPNHTFIFLTAESKNLLPTILSRCQIIYTNDDQIEGDSSQPLLPKSLTISQALLHAQKISKEKSEAIMFLESQMRNHHKILQEDSSLNEGDLMQYSSLLKELFKTYRLIKSSNVNVRFTLENLFLSDIFQK